MTFRDDNGNELEFGGEFAMTKQAVSFFNGSINGDVSINFTVDNNSVNRKVLNYYGPQMTSQVAFTKQAFNRVQNGNILDRGYIVIQNEDGDKLSCFYVSGNSNWVQLFKGDYINELDFTGKLGKDYVVSWDRTSVLASVGSTDGIIFPFVDWSYNLKKGNTRYFLAGSPPGLFASYGIKLTDITNNPDVSVFDFYPCFYVSSLMDVIFNQNGLKLSGNLLNDPIYKSLIVPPDNGLIKRQPFKNIYVVGSSQSITASSTVKYTSFTVVNNPDGLFSNNSLIANKKSSVVFTISGVLRSSTDVNRISIYRNGAEVFFTAWGSVDDQSYKTNPYPCVIGDVFEIYLRNVNVGAQTATINLLIEFPSIVEADQYVSPSDFLPNLLCSDFIKNIFNYFGCCVYFNEFNKTITANIIESIKTETALDWSEYYQSHRSEYTVTQAMNNYIRLNENEDPTLVKYNKSHKLKYGEGVISTNNTLKNNLNVLSLKFSASSFGLSKNLINLSNIPLVSLNDDTTSIPYTAIANVSTGLSSFAVSSGSIFNANEIIRISNSTGDDLGYFVIQSRGATNINVYFEFVGSDSGSIYRQNITYNSIGFRLLTVLNSVNITDIFSGSSEFRIENNTSSSLPSSLPFAIFNKSYTGKNTIDQWKNNLAIDNPDSGGFTDPTIKQLYFNKISKFLQNPNIRCKMLLPESVYQSFVFDQFIYLRTENLTGYFFVDSIVNYVDGNTPVEVNLYML